jgi:hypothetical protein
MSQLIRLFNVFVSSPRDVADERERLKKVASRINATLLRGKGALLNLLFYQTDVLSSKGTDLQDVINQQIGDSYDVYLGIVWSRIGTGTPRGESGTVEEFERALRRHGNGERTLRFMFFVRTGGYPDDTDPKQLEAVQRFRSRLQTEGILARPYRTMEEFEDAAFDHLQGYMQEQLATSEPDAIAARRSPLVRVRTLLPDIGVRLVEAASDLKALSQRETRKQETRLLLSALEGDLKQIERLVEVIENQIRRDHTALAGEVVFGDEANRSVAAQRIRDLLLDTTATKEVFDEWHGSLVGLVQAEDLDGAFRVHITKVIGAAERLVSVACRSLSDLQKLEDLTSRVPEAPQRPPMSPT